MPKSTPVVFKTSLLAVAVLSMSACSSMPKVPSIDLGGVGEGIVKAGKATADVSRKTWNTTSYLLGFSDTKDGSDPETPTDEQLLVADSEEDINQVLPLADAPDIEPEILTTDNQTTDDESPVLVLEATAPSAEVLEPAEDIVVAAADEDIITEEDLIHEVASNETLWDIAKLTTGDANNWHKLADVNNLTQNATVFPGQALVIPSDLVKPDYDTPMASAEPEVLIDTQDISAALKKEVAESEQLTLPADEQATDVAQTDSDIAKEQEKLAQLAAISKDAAPYDLNTGETLWDFAKRTTGDATNWQAIADQNNFTEKQAVTVRPGQTIFVPEALLKTELGATEAAVVTDTVALKPEESTVVTAVEETVALVVEEKIPEAVEETVAAALPVEPETQLIENAEEVTASVSALDETQPIKIVEATYKTDDGPTPLSDAVESVQMVENPNIPAEIVVSGTYYPKAVYNSADFSSSLLMRVSPGTSLQVSRAMGTWFEVETDKGVGYVHQRDIK